ncbi:thiamine pyrophosphate enzyme [Colletotrichum scovillei]|uniref:thiamine pyrophosphate enzyme n=1 Tax=Colletotrichum scovillei TaxID=1209932 RepID=UPI0015C3596F|nr:thiamine pyrophosphate enzyme [Colletotrichum scovillei]KAF4779622.1 thiamine pyrophosphate enzyme [Colletotrichum scovillei]
MTQDRKPPTVKLAEYLFTRLHQLGIGAIHGVPGDFNLSLLDYVEPAGLLWVGNANELNAGYAADGYARLVSRDSAINAVAGAYAERAAVVHIVGTPSRVLQDSRTLMHHGFNDGNYRRFAEMHSHVTVAQANLRDASSAPRQIDEVLRQCLTQSRPVYIEIPQDLVVVPVSTDGLDTDSFARCQTRPLYYRADRGTGESHGWPTWTTAFSKSLVDESLPNYHGIYSGRFADPAVKTFVEKADLILCFGPHFSSTNTYAFSSIPKPDVTILFSANIKIADQTFRDVSVRAVVRSLIERLEKSKVHQYAPYPELPRDHGIEFSEVASEEKITQSKFWHLTSSFVRPGDIIFGETGTAGHGSRVFALPAHTRMFLPTTWLSIGYMLPAAQGAALAQRELIQSSKYHDIKEARTILFIGDGSFQMTVQEISTMIRHKLDVIIVLLNNDGYTIERYMHGCISPTTTLPAGATCRRRVSSEAIQRLLTDDQLKDGKGLRMVEVFMDPDDAPEGALLDLMQKEKKRIADSQ